MGDIIGDMSSLIGQFLLSSPHMSDGNFAHTITLMIEHNEQGAMGVVINCPTEMTVERAWERYSESPCAIDDVIYDGGPCPGPLLALHDNADLAMAQICTGVLFTSDPDQIEELVKYSKQPLRLLIGYAGWCGGQFESELARNDWIITPASAQDVFSDDPAHWAKLVKPNLNKIGLPNVNPISIPTDPSMN